MNLQTPKKHLKQFLLGTLKWSLGFLVVIVVISAIAAFIAAKAHKSAFDEVQSELQKAPQGVDTGKQ